MIPSPGALIDQLRAADASLRTLAPSPRLEARILAQARAARRRAPILALLHLESRPLRRSLLLVFAAALLVFALVRRDAPSDSADAPREAEGTTDPIVNDRIRHDTDPTADELAGPRRGSPFRVLSPAIAPGPRARDPQLAPASSVPAPAKTAPEPPEPLGWLDESDAPSGAGPRPARRPLPGGEIPGWSPAAVASANGNSVLGAVRHAGGGGSSRVPAAASALPPKEPSAPAPTCTGGTIGHGICSDPGAFKTAATTSCPEGRVLTDLQLDSGICPAGLFASAYFACCPAPDTVPPPTLKEPANNGSSCEERQSSGPGCQPVSALEAQAKEACAASGLQLVDRKFSGACPEGEAADSWFTCCAQPPDPQPTSCMESVIGSGLCQDLGVLKTLAVDGCPPGLALHDLKLEGACPDGQAKNAWLLCCVP